MYYFISLVLLFLVVDGPLQTNVILMYLNINGLELKTAVRLTPYAVRAALSGLDATKRPKPGHRKISYVTFSPSSPALTSEFRGKHLLDCE